MVDSREKYYQQKQKHINKSKSLYKNSDLCECGMIYKDHISETGNWKYRHYFVKSNKKKDTKVTPENYQSKLSVIVPMGTKKSEDDKDGRLQHHREMANYHADKQESGGNPEYSADKEAYHRDMAAKLESQKTAPMGALPYSETAAKIHDDATCECGALYKEHLKKEQFKLKKDIAAISTPGVPGVSPGVPMI